MYMYMHTLKKTDWSCYICGYKSHTFNLKWHPPVAYMKLSIQKILADSDFTQVTPTLKMIPVKLKVAINMDTSVQHI